MRWMVRGDIDGFFGLALDNLVQLILIDQLCRHVLGFPDALLYSRVLPGVAVSLLVGNVYYAWQARRLALRERRDDVCALPYGINTVSLFAHVFLVMLPAKALATAAGAPDPARVAWQAGLFATLSSGLIELAAAPIAERVRKATPRAAVGGEGRLEPGLTFRQARRERNLQVGHAVLGAATLGAATLGAAALGAVVAVPPVVQAAANTAIAMRTTSHLARVVPLSIMRSPPQMTAHHVAAPWDDDAPTHGGT